MGNDPEENLGVMLEFHQAGDYVDLATVDSAVAGLSAQVEEAGYGILSVDVKIVVAGKVNLFEIIIVGERV